jgi:glutamyl-tRNA reductase
VIDQTLSGRRAHIPAVEQIVSAHVGEYLRWYRTRGAAPLIASLREKAEQIRSAEIEKLFARIPELDEQQRQLVIATSVSMINKLLHAPVTKLRESAARSEAVDEAALVQTLLDVDAFSDRLQRQLDARTAPLFTNAKDA